MRLLETMRRAYAQVWDNPADDYDMIADMAEALVTVETIEAYVRNEMDGCLLVENARDNLRALLGVPQHEEAGT